MEIYSTLASVFTVISFFVFIGIVVWAYSAQRQSAFEAAAKEPFALPDEVDFQAAGPDPRRSRPAVNRSLAGAGELGQSARDPHRTGVRR